MKYFNYGEKELEYLKNKDKKLKEVIEQIGIIHREVESDLLIALLSSIAAQQISTKAAKTVWSRFLCVVGEVSVESVRELSVEAIQQCGMSMRKATYIKNLCLAVDSGVLHLDELTTMSDDEVIKKLSSLDGIGIWTAEMILLFSMERLDVLSYGDLAIRKGLMKLYRHKTLSKEQFLRYKKRYSPYGSVASLYLWQLASMN